MRNQLNTDVSRVADTLLGDVAPTDDSHRERFQTLKELLLALAAKDLYTFQHSHRVSALARQLARSLCPFDADFIRRVHIAGLLHDVGKVDVPLAILVKCGPLTESERGYIQAHPRGSAYSLASHLDSETVAMVLSHHEHIDGGGYPDGLRGESIPLGSRIIAVADAYDAMTSTRPYRGAMELERALEILQAGAGTQWDSEIVAALHSLMAPQRVTLQPVSLTSAAARKTSRQQTA